MSGTGRQLNPMLWGIFLALTAITAFLYFTVYALLVIIPLTVYFMWSMHLRIRVLERRLALSQPTSAEKNEPQS